MADNNVTQIEDMDEFRRRENLFRTDPAARADAINQLAEVGGETARDTTNNTMDRLLSNGVMAQFSLKGKRGKMNFSITEICSVLKEAIIRASGAPVNEVDAAMKERLRGAGTDVVLVGDMDGELIRIEDMDQFRWRDDLFQTNPTVRADAINQLANVGGETVRDTTYNAMDRLLSNGVMAQFNFTGKGVKMNFSITGICALLREAIIRASGAPVNDVEAAMKAHLRKAPDRRGGGGR